jgi:hypothetical protein
MLCRVATSLGRLASVSVTIAIDDMASSLQVVQNLALLV